ncbi:hypothetical protein KXV87_007711 [Aspergillus fumigatus]|nr:hypothetical protein KXV87_007711 [Aspergillus fumigatus]
MLPEDVDWNAFVQQPDNKTEGNFAETTKSRILHVKQNFQKFSSKLDPPKYEYWVKNITLRLIEGFLRWYLNDHNLVCTTLTDEYELDLGAKTQPPINIDDLLYKTYHIMALTNVHFATVRCRHQHSCLRKMMSSTSARPGTLVESEGYMRRPDSLKWKDIELYMVKHPENPACQTLLMRVTHRLNKGKRNKGVAPVYTYTERNDNLGLCVIQDVLEFAFRDGAFASKYIKEPRDIWRYTHVPAHRLSTPIHFKEDVQEIPVFRRAVKDAEGRWITHPKSALPYKKLQEDEVATSRSDGSKDPGSLYKYRKGAAANLRHLDEHSRNIIMGHSRSHTFAYYVQVQDDTQSAFMGTPTRDALIKLATNSSLTRDASVPQHLSDEKKQEIEQLTELTDLKRKRDQLRRDLIAQYHQLHRARGTVLYSEFERAQRQVRARRKKLHKAAKDQQHDNFFKNVGNRIVEGNYQGKPLTFEPDISHVVPERKALADLEFKNRDVDKISDSELLEDRIRSLEMRLALYGLEVPKALQKRITFREPPPKTASCPEISDTLPLESKSGLECPVCLGRPGLHSRARRYTYARKDTLQRHFETHNLKQKFPKGRLCDYPGCEELFYTLSKYKLHLHMVHKISL